MLSLVFCIDVHIYGNLENIKIDQLNQLPPFLHHMNCVATFKRHLKAILFTLAYGVIDN